MISNAPGVNVKVADSPPVLLGIVLRAADKRRLVLAYIQESLDEFEGLYGAERGRAYYCAVLRFRDQGPCVLICL